MRFDLGDFALIDMLQCGRGIREAASASKSMEESATAIVDYLYRECGTASSSDQECALVRFYKTSAYGDLDPDLKEYARTQMGGIQPDARMKCLALLATMGHEPAWRDPRTSVGHRAIPLPSVRIVEEAPMIAQLIREMGLDLSDVISPDASLLEDRAGRTYNVFHVEDARGSPYIPAQKEFVERYSVRSVVGFGGLLPDGELFAVIIFARGHIPRESAARFRNIALDVKASIHPFAQPFIRARETDQPGSDP